MPFGIDVDLERAKREIKETLESFCVTYVKAFNVALVEKIMADALEAKEDSVDTMKLKSIPAKTPPTKEGKMKRRTAVLGRWKDKHFWINDEWELAYSNSADNKEKPDVINLWGYKVQGIQFKPEGPRKGGPDWIPDEERPNCIKCNKAFSTVVWHHHCRNCGEVFCSDCAGNKMPLPHFGYEKDQRVCDGCYEEHGKGRGRAGTFAVKDEDAKEDAAFHGIQLLHSKRTPHVLQCETLDDKKAWMEVLKECCKEAKPPINSDPVLAAAFEAAHQQASWHAGWYWWWRITGDESEMVSDLISHVIERTVVNPAIDGAPANIPTKVKRMASTAINKQIQALIRAAVGPAWKKVADQVKDMREAVEEKIKPAVDVISKAKADILAKMQEGIMKVVDPVMDKTGSVILEKIMAKVCGPILEAHKSTYAILNAEVQKLAKAAKDPASLKSEAARARADLHYWWGPMRTVNDGLDEFRRDVQDLIAGSDALSHISVSKLVGVATDRLHTLLDNAIYTLESDPSLAENVSEDAVLKAWGPIFEDALHDSQMLVLQSYNDILSMSLKPPVQQLVLQNDATTAVLEPLDALIPEAVSSFISVSSLLEELLDNVLSASIDKAIESGKQGTLGDLASAHGGAK